FVLRDRTAQVAAKLVEPQRRVGGGEVVLCVHGIVAEELEQVAVVGVAAGLGDHVDDVAGGASVFGRVSPGLDLEFLDAVNAGAADARGLPSQLGADRVYVNTGGVSAVEQHIDAGKSGLV